MAPSNVLPIWNRVDMKEMAMKEYTTILKTWRITIRWLIVISLSERAQSAGVVEYTGCISPERVRSPQ